MNMPYQQMVPPPYHAPYPQQPHFNHKPPVN